MNHYKFGEKPQNLWKEFFLPFLLQFVLLVFTIIPHRIFIHIGSPIMEPVMYGDEMTDPTSGRLFYVFFAMVMCIVLAVIGGKLAKKGKLFSPFYLGVVGGTFLWQSLGEDAWNFGLGESGEITYFLQMESIQVLPIVIPFLILVGYGVVHHSFDWCVLNVLLSFICNWMGHYVSLGTYFLVASKFSLEQWCVVAGISFGALFILLGLLLGIFASKDTKARLTASMIMYIGVGILVFGFVG